jgi:hypothetical protein
MTEPTTEDLDRLVDAVRDARDDDALATALRQLREANGVMTVGTSSDYIMRLIKRRRRQGYSWQQVAWMVGLSRGHCCNLVDGRRSVPA